MAYEPELERLERRYQDDPARNFAQLAEAYRKANRLDDALTLLQGHLTERPNYVSGLVVLGRCLLDQQNDAEARDTFERVLGVDSEHIIALRALGEIAERGGDHTAARQWFTRLLDVDPMNEDAEQALARIEAAVTAGPAEPEDAAAVAGVMDLAGVADAAPEPAPTAAPEPADREPPVTFPVPQLEQPTWAPRTAAFAGEESVPALPEPDEDAEPAESAGQDEPAELQVDPEFVLEQADDRFMPRPSGAHPRGVESIGELDIQSRLEEEEPPIGSVRAADEEPYQFPTGEQEVDLGFGGETDAAGQRTDEAPGGAQEPGLMAFDDALGWGAGERTSRQISREDLEEIEHVHEDTVAPVSELLGGDLGEGPMDGAAEVGPVEGLQEFESADVAPLEGLEATVQDREQAEEPVAFIEQGPDDLEVVSEDVEAVVPEVPEETDDAMMDASGEIVDRGTAERRASLMGLPLLEGPTPPEPDEPLVLEAEPEPVVTETMAELYVKQGLFDEAREVYQHLLSQRPGHTRIEARLAELSAAPKPAAPSVRYDAARSGGQSARAMMMAVLGARPGEAADVMVRANRAVAAAPVAPPVAPVAPAAPAADTGADPMDQAFSEDHGDAALGAPTQPAADEVTLSAIFGEPPPPEAPTKEPPRPAEPKAPGGRAPGGFSFDEFFGKPGGSAPDGADRPQRDSMADDEGEEAFRDWLKGLKG